MSDHIAAVRAQAEKEALRINRIHRENLGDNEMFDSAYALGFVNGSTWLASRLTREKIADTITNRPTGQSAADAVLGLLTDTP